MNFIHQESAQKLRGGYYTPANLAVFISKWVNQIKPKNLLEPSCGDGAFLSAMAQISDLKQSNIVGFELESSEAAKSTERASQLGLTNAKIHNEDFLQWALQKMTTDQQEFDAVVGNPPFIRYQYLPALFQAHAEQVFRILALPFTKHTNAWVPFILASLKLLRNGGRLAMVVPSEIIHVMHASSLRAYLGSECRRLVIIDPEEIWFEGTLQGAVILLAEKKQSRADYSEGLGIYPVKGREFLNLSPEAIFNKPQSINGKTVEGKWTRAILDQSTRDLIDELDQHKEVHIFDDIAQVDVGIVTGANKFFLVHDETVEQYNLGQWAHPMFGRSEHCPGIIYDEAQHKANAAKGKPSNFLWFKKNEEKLHEKALQYIKSGETDRLHTRYKCRIRSPWYSVPSVYSTEIGMLKRAHDAPRLILNSVGAYTTDTAYRIRTNRVDASQLVGCFVNPLTALSAELEGRHYGGGVLELVPSEIERLRIPLPHNAKLDLSALDLAVKSQSTLSILEAQSNVVLGGVGLTAEKQACLLDGWLKLRNRRHRISS